MSEERKRGAAGSGLDTAIDGAVRQMLDVDPPGGLRGRVLRRIDEGGRRGASAFVPSGFRRNLLWTSLPLAAVAMLLLAVMVSWRTSEPTRSPVAPQVAADAHPAAVPPPSRHPVPPSPAPIETARPRVERSPGPAAPRPASLTAAPVPTSDKPERMIAAAALETQDTRFGLPPLDGPEALSIRELVTPPTPSLPSTAPEPMQIQALEISALPELPPARRKE